MVRFEYGIVRDSKSKLYVIKLIYESYQYCYVPLRYLSTLAVLQLDAILTNSKVVSTVPSKHNGNQKPFEKMIVMKYDCVGIGVIKMTVGVRRRTHEKVQYCITALQIEKDAMTASI